MKNKIWLFQIPMVAMFTFALYVLEAGIQGDLKNDFLRGKAFPFLRVVSGFFTNTKFRLRGPEAPKNKIVIVEVDSDALAYIGRWPWHRDATSYLVEKTFAAGAKVVGLDMVFSEPDKRVDDELAKLMQSSGIGQRIAEFETDLFLEKTISEHKDKLVLGWATDTWCQPAFGNADTCPVTDPETIKRFPKGFEKFAYSEFNAPGGFDQGKTPLMATPEMIANIEMYNQAGLHAGFFSAWPDEDGYIRRSPLFMTSNGKAYPSLALEIARTVLNEKLALNLNAQGTVENITFANSGRQIPVTPLGAMDINFRGPAYTFQYVRALEILLKDGDEIQIERDRKIASVSKSEILKDAIVLIGVTAIGSHDMRAFPFDSNVPGVEGHANILDNLLSGDMLRYRTSKADTIWLLLLMSVGALLFAYMSERLESVPALLLFIFAMSGLTFVDLKVLFAHHVDWNTGFLYIELVAIFMFTFSVKYVLEEKNKKFIRGAFAKYVSPAIIDSIMKDPSKLTVGGEKRDLTILFSDIRGFTSFSEKMDAKHLAAFLNDYLGTMTDIVFECEGTLDKYIGDAVMAFWGAPLDQPKHAANAAKAAVRMLEALAANRDRYLTQWGVEVNIGIGINSGPVNVGNMGSERIFEYTVIGDHVNLASRLEGLTKTYGTGIVTTRFTFDHIVGAGEPLPKHRVLDFVKVKGKKTAVELIQVIDRQLSDEGLKLFQEGRELYLKQQWDQAIEKFTAADHLLRPNPEKMDGPSEMYIDRCKEFKQSPPNADWDGSWEMHSK